MRFAEKYHQLSAPLVDISFKKETCLPAPSHSVAHYV
jgi:hypothetical protein